jgi:hypothetical protein
MIEHIKRDANFAPHGLVRKAIKYVIYQVWLWEIPTCIYGILFRVQFASD